ncbi:Branched-chain amino acid aminotransferase/4-amino-4-deoxychorismate lyase [Actinobacillus ureae]|uniref:aminotransferase class IV family protein n=1 Tax=Actinobacillus ureae TaxID=723 RepID=UPI0005C6F2F2|nr:aminotransferase class IV family protein [Actinobacillus ureae]SUT86884.1 Branched-chain amino acid aminotransferase/4-amino-4-deoxychorismate lyase [Actinobacillus ureae]SUU47334.1 Branched-chain amino acid aminotransferase/4-amino-4-deoxychorismate lyase [Actinobacillus ureae]
MCRFPLFETIAIIDGEPQNLAYHQQRFESAIKQYFNAQPQWQLADMICVPNEFRQGNVRCRIDYNAGEFQQRFFLYTPRKISTFQCVYTEDLDYCFKYSDRKRLDLLKTLQADEVIIINNGKVSDCTIGNLLFSRKGRWFSSRDYLLKGTQLTKLVEEGIVQLVQITPQDLPQYEQIMMVNALNPFDLQRVLPISAINFVR